MEMVDLLRRPLKGRAERRGISFLAFLYVNVQTACNQCRFAEPNQKRVTVNGIVYPKER